MAYVASLTRLREHVRSELERMARAFDGEDYVSFRSARCRLLEQLDADVREVRADVEALMERDGVGW